MALLSLTSTRSVGHFDIFLSYCWGTAAARKPLADEVYRALRAAGLRVWMDELEMGHDLAASMSEGIAKSDAVVMLVSPSYAASGPCMFEARAAVAAGKPLVACCAEPGFWRSWRAADGSGATALPDEHELVSLARLTTHLWVDLGEASAVAWAAEAGVPADERQRLARPEALPRLLVLVEAALAEGRACAGAGCAPGRGGASPLEPGASSTPSSALPASLALPPSSLENAAEGVHAGAGATLGVSSSESASAGGQQPPNLSAQNPQPAEAATAAVPALVWRAHADENGTPFFVCEATGEAAWELPQGAAFVG